MLGAANGRSNVQRDMKYPEWKEKFVDTYGGKAYNEGVGGGKVNILPNAATAVISIRKFTEYALHPVKSKGKAYAFEKVLGNNLSNSDKLIENIRMNLANFEAKLKGDNGFGFKYEVMMDLLGENGNRANVLTSWIVEHKTGDTRLKSAYIKSGRRKND